MKVWLDILQFLESVLTLQELLSQARRGKNGRGSPENDDLTLAWQAESRRGHLGRLRLAVKALTPSFGCFAWFARPVGLCNVSTDLFFGKFLAKCLSS